MAAPLLGCCGLRIAGSRSSAQKGVGVEAQLLSCDGTVPLNKVREKADKNGKVDNSGIKSATQSVLTSANSAERVPVPSKPVDRSQVTIGIDRAELIKRCGEPS